jgi:hypothetical protein
MEISTAYASASKARKEQLSQNARHRQSSCNKMKDPELYLEVVIADKKQLRIALEVPPSALPTTTIEALTILEYETRRE